MRTASAGALAQLAQNLGGLPGNILEIQWVEGGTRYVYGDLDIEADGIKGKILEISALDAVVNVSAGSDSQGISVVLDDTDGEIKDILDLHDIHKRPCWVYQWFQNLPTSDKFLLFKGYISSPLTWNEGDRTVSFDVISQIEDVEVGFSIEEGDIDSPPEHLIGQPWPLCFGTVFNVPMLKLQSVRQGILETGVGIADPSLPARIHAAGHVICPVVFNGFQATYNSLMSLIIQPIFSRDPQCQAQRTQAVELLECQLTQQQAFEFDTITIFKGEQFPQGVTLTLNISGAKFIGSFSGKVFTIDQRIHPEVDELNIPNSVFGLSQGDGVIAIGSNLTADAVLAAFNDAPASTAQRTVLTELAEAREDYEAATGIVCGGSAAISLDPALTAIEASRQIAGAVPQSSFFWANTGDTVTLDGDEEIIYVANILPSTILRVAAYRQFDNGQALVTVPEDWYTVREVDYQSYQVVEIVFDRPLSRRGNGWTDNVFVSLTSSVGPNTVDIIEWLIGQYTDFTTDATSFNAVRTLVENYPMHFAILSRPNIIELLEQIAYQARCAIWMRDDVFYLRYLPADPVVHETITKSAMIHNTFEIFHTDTEDLETKVTIDWRTDYEKPEPNKWIAAHNVGKYGVQKGDYDYFTFNILELVRKSGTFWLIRKSNTWRKIRFDVPLRYARLETFDCIEVDHPALSDDPVKCIIEEASFDTEGFKIHIEAWTPIKSGSRTPYDFAYPAAIDEFELFPTEDERDAGLAGVGSGHPNFIVRPPDDHPLANPPQLWQGFQLACNGGPVEGLPGEGQCRESFGNRYPSDVGDTKPDPSGVGGTTVDPGVADGTGTGNRSGVQGTNTSCCDELRRKIAEVEAAAQKALEAASAALAASPPEGTEEDLPECDSCFFVVVRGGTVNTVTRDGLAGRTDGCGTQQASTHNNQEKKYCFRSLAAAQAFRSTVEAQIAAKLASNNYCVGEYIDTFISGFSNHGDGPQCDGDEFDDEGNPVVIGLTITPFGPQT